MSVGGLAHSRIATKWTWSLLCTRTVFGPHVDGDLRRGGFILTVGRIPASRFASPSNASELEFITNCIILNATIFFELIP